MNNRWIECEISIVHKINRGSFGIKYERQGTFRFCARSEDDAVAVAGHHVMGATTSIDTSQMVQVVGAIPVQPDRSDECLYQDHDLCNFAWCKCPHHSAVQFKLEHPQLKSLSELQSETESEAA